MLWNSGRIRNTIGQPSLLKTPNPKAEPKGKVMERRTTGKISVSSPIHPDLDFREILRIGAGPSRPLRGEDG